MLIKAKLAWLHLLESSSREEEEEEAGVDQGYVRIDQHSSPSEDMPKSAFPILVYGGASCDLHQARRNQERWFVLRK